MQTTHKHIKVWCMALSLLYYHLHCSTCKQQTHTPKYDAWRWVFCTTTCTAAHANNKHTHQSMMHGVESSVLPLALQHMQTTHKHTKVWCMALSLLYYHLHCSTCKQHTNTPKYDAWRWVFCTTTCTAAHANNKQTHQSMMYGVESSVLPLALQHMQTTHKHTNVWCMALSFHRKVVKLLATKRFGFFCLYGVFIKRSSDLTTT